jgi:hypothetical protein
MDGFTVVVKVPPVPVVTVATCWVEDEPTVRDEITTDSLASPDEIFPEISVDPPYVTIGAPAVRVTSGGGPVTVVVPFIAGCSASW